LLIFLGDFFCAGTSAAWTESMVVVGLNFPRSKADLAHALAGATSARPPPSQAKLFELDFVYREDVIVNIGARILLAKAKFWAFTPVSTFSAFATRALRP